LRCIVESLGDEPVRVVATIGNEDRPAWVDALPSNATVERYVPHAQLLPGCSALVHHGGAGTMYAALAHGLPQVIVPTAADQFDNAATMRAAELALTLDADALTAQTLRAAVRTALENSAIRARAREVAAEIRAMPDAASVAATLQARFDRPAKRPVAV
jgi:UDP:flavonoid glycosyltransferase YjiC (YdhE family)